MKNLFVLVACSFFILYGGANAQVMSSKKILIVYLSRTNNTKAIAEIVQKNVGGKILAIELQTPYPENYKATVAQVVRENEENFLPPLKTKIDSIQNYEVVFIGFPTWDMKMPPPMKSFLRGHDFKGKTIIPFNTNAGYGVGTGFETVKALCPNSRMLDGFEMKAGAEKDGKFLVIKDEIARAAEKKVADWLKKIKMIL